MQHRRVLKQGPLAGYLMHSYLQASPVSDHGKGLDMAAHNAEHKQLSSSGMVPHGVLQRGVVAVYLVHQYLQASLISGHGIGLHMGHRQ